MNVRDLLLEMGLLQIVIPKKGSIEALKKSWNCEATKKQETNKHGIKILRK